MSHNSREPGASERVQFEQIELRLQLCCGLLRANYVPPLFLLLPLCIMGCGFCCQTPKRISHAKVSNTTQHRMINHQAL